MKDLAGSACARGAFVACAVALAAVPSHALTLEFPGKATQTGNRTEALTSYRVPVGGWDGRTIPTRLAEGPLDQTAWRIDTTGQTTLQLLLPLREQLRRDGFQPIYECEAAVCGGFDFRYGTDVLPEPEMHVDLGDFRYVALRRDGTAGPEYASLIVSRAADQGFVQLTRIGAFAEPAPQLALSTKTPAPRGDTQPGAAAAPQDLAATLAAEGAVALDDLVFPVGASTLEQADYASLAELADWLRADATRRVALVGHTDASGSLDANKALSLKRAESVRQTLIARNGVPAAQLVAQGVGYLAPRDTNQTEEGRERNRRVEAMLIAAP
ncbi:MAG: OmpA family protein [Paracoccaceae bacterium]